MADLINFEELIQPIPGDNPAGAPIPDLMRFELDDLRKEADPFDPATAGRRADWPKIIRITSDALTNKSKDFLIAARLLEALTKRHGITGLRDGLQLLLRLTTECWDRIHPTPGEGETMDVREGPFKWLNDSSRGARFPQAIMEQAIAKGGGRTFSYIDWIVPENKGEFEENIPRLDPAHLKKSYGELQEAEQLLREFSTALDERMGADVAPDFLSPENNTNIGNSIRKSIELVEQLAKQRGVKLVETPAEESSDESPAEEQSSGGDDSSGMGNLDSIPQTRDALYGQISRIAEKLRRIEPHSPIPYMLDRCVRLGSLPFPELMRAMVRESAALDELDRLIGVGSDSSPSASE